MTTKSRLTFLALSTAAAGALFSSCAYDPYYTTSTSVGYNSNGHVSSSVFISTNNSRWGYDPHCHSYYDYTRQCYYDPYLCGYYPRGYRPPVLVGVPHPHGWRPGLSTCAPPSNVRNYNLTDYGNRYQNYRNLNQSWCHNVRNGSNSNTNYYNGNSSGNHGSYGHTPSHSNSIWNRSGQNSNNTTNNRGNRGANPTYVTNPGTRSQRSIDSPNPQPRTYTGSQYQNNNNRQPQTGNRNNSSSNGRSNWSQPSVQRNQPSSPTTPSYPTTITPSPRSSIRQSAAPDPQVVAERMASMRQSVEQAKANGTLKRR